MQKISRQFEKPYLTLLCHSHRYPHSWWCWVCARGCTRRCSACAASLAGLLGRSCCRLPGCWPAEGRRRPQEWWRPPLPPIRTSAQRRTRWSRSWAPPAREQNMTEQKPWNSCTLHPASARGRSGVLLQVLCNATSPSGGRCRLSRLLCAMLLHMLRQVTETLASLNIIMRCLDRPEAKWCSSCSLSKRHQNTSCTGLSGDGDVVKWHAHTCAHVGTVAGMHGLPKVVQICNYTCNNNASHLSDCSC